VVKRQNKHSGLQAVDEQSKRFFTGGIFQWEKEKANVWNELEAQLSQPEGRVVKMNIAAMKWAVAALFIALVGIGSFMRYAVNSVETKAGEHLSMTLPDGSTVDLNAQSVVRYNPYWWRFDRKVTFAGEAIFSVEKGKRFRVISDLGSTEVLGTRFNIFARENTYKVTCLEGSVKVTSNYGKETILTPNDKVTLQPEGTVILQKNVEIVPEISWKDYSFFFTAVPVSNVFSEIERQYGVTINARVDLSTLYTGNFSKNQHVEEVLGYVCPALGFKYVRLSKTTFSVIPDTK
jgi:ferric-dicitrate binding protein FerR (iron transport regulator)